MVKENLKTDRIRGLKRDRFHQLQDSQLSHYTPGVYTLTLHTRVEQKKSG